MATPKFFEYGDWRDEEFGDNIADSPSDGPLLDQATEAAMAAGIPYRVERHVADATQLSLRHADPEGGGRDGWKSDDVEPIFANTEVFMPGQHHTYYDDPQSARERLRSAYRGTRRTT